MCAGGRDFQPVLRSQFRKFAAKIDDLLPGITRIAANVGPQFRDRLVELRLNLLLQNQFAVSQDLLDVRTQLARLRIDNLEFLFDAESKDVVTFHQSLNVTFHRRRHSASVGRYCAEIGSVFDALQKLRPVRVLEFVLE